MSILGSVQESVAMQTKLSGAQISSTILDDNGADLSHSCPPSFSAPHFPQAASVSPVIDQALGHKCC